MSALNKNYPYSSSLTKTDVDRQYEKKLDSVDYGLNT